MSTSTIADRHLATLAAAAIPADVAKKFGIWSAETVSDLPDDLASRRSSVPGLVFPLETIDGSVVHQIRVDDPEQNDGAKCLQPGGIGSVITCYEPMRGRIGEDGVDRILVVEGTKQTIVATQYAPDDTVVCGVQGCRNWSSGGIAIPELAMLEPEGKEVVLAFDADLKSNFAVWDAARLLSENLKQLGARSVLFLSTNSGGKVGLDDYLGSSHPEDRLGRSQAGVLRAKTLARLMELATPKLGRAPKRVRPPKTRSAQPFVCDMSKGVTVRPGTSSSASFAAAVPDEVVADFAARIVRVTSIRDPDDPEHVAPLQLELEVAVPNGYGGVDLYSPVRASDNTLHRLGDILAALPGGAGGSIPRPSSPDDVKVANAIRACRTDEVEFVQAWRRLGWQVHEGRLYYLHSGGGITSEGNDTSVQAWMSSVDRVIDFSGSIWLAEQDPDQLRESIRESIEMLDDLVDPTPWFAMLATAGLAPLGPIPKAAVGLVAPPSAGKSVILQTAAAFLAPEWAYGSRVMNSADATVVATDLALSGHDNSWVMIDDLHPELSRSERERQSKGIDAALRRSHGAPSKAKGMVSKSTGEVESAKRNQSAPIVHLSIEPEVMSNLANSGVDRMLTIVMDAETSFKEGGAGRFTKAGQSGRLQLAYANYILATARDIEAGHAGVSGVVMDGHLGDIGLDQWPTDPGAALAAWQNFWTGEREYLGPALAARCPSASKRAIGVVVGLAVGLERWLHYAVRMGAISQEESTSLIRKGGEMFVQALNRHTTKAMDEQVSPVEGALRAYHAAIASGRFALSVKGRPDPPGATIVGKKAIVGGVECVALLNEAVVPGVHGKPSSVLADIAIPGPDGSRSRQVRFDDSRPMCVAIPIYVWESMGRPELDGTGEQAAIAVRSGEGTEDETDDEANDFGYVENDDA